jgi:hypothetical protein
MIMMMIMMGPIGLVIYCDIVVLLLFMVTIGGCSSGYLMGEKKKGIF